MPPRSSVPSPLSLSHLARCVLWLLAGDLAVATASLGGGIMGVGPAFAAVAVAQSDVDAGAAAPLANARACALVAEAKGWSPAHAARITSANACRFLDANAASTAAASESSSHVAAGAAVAITAHGVAQCSIDDGNGAYDGAVDGATAPLGRGGHPR